MIEKNQITRSKWIDISLWFMIVSITVSGSFLMYYFREQISVFRLLFTFSGLAGVLGLAIQTSQGRDVVAYAGSAWVEMAKVVWPKTAEAKHISIVVVCAIAVITSALWIVDSLLTMVVKGLLG